MTKFQISYVVYPNADVNYTYVNDCDAYGCYDEKICRCGRIEDAIVTNINAEKCLHILIKNDNDETSFQPYKLSNIELECVKKILSKNNAYNVNSYDVIVCGGYYGEEIEKVVFDNADKVIESVETLLNLKTKKEKMKFLENL